MQIKDAIKELIPKVNDTFLLYLLQYKMIAWKENECRYIQSGDSNRGVQSYSGPFSGDGQNIPHSHEVILSLEYAQRQPCCHKIHRETVEWRGRTDSDHKLEAMLATWIKLRINQDTGLNLNSTLYNIEEMERMARTCGI